MNARSTMPWPPTDEVVPAGDDHAELVQQLRRLQDAVAVASPPGQVMADAAAALARVSAALEAHAVDEPERLSGTRELPGRGQALSPVMHVDHYDTARSRGRVTYGPFYLGRNGAAHGGALPLLFDELLGRQVQLDGTVARTAFLHVDFRSLARLGHELVFRSQLDRVEGRKRFASGTLHDGDVLVAEAHGLFVELRPGQP